MTARKVMLSAIQPTNRLTLGNYIGAIKNWVRLYESYDCYFFAVDMHSITVRQDPKQLTANTLFAIATYIASGIDPSKCVLFVQSHVRQHAELAWILNCFSYMGELSRMTQFKDKSEKAGTNIPVGLFTYPVLMAADILLYDTEFVPVGADQKQHIELTRDIALRMNGVYGEDTFTVPKPLIAEVGARIMDLQDPTTKMSKSGSSESGAIYLSDSLSDIEKKVKRATTDSGATIEFLDEKPGVKNLIAIQSAISGRTPEAIVQGYQGKMYGHLKVDTAEIIVNELRPVQQRTAELLSDKGELLRILKAGAEKAAIKAERKLRLVSERVGFQSLT
jgi:tryptophanyl-tRNA synthetase